MSDRVQQAREHWSTVLTAGGCTAVPRWSADPRPGVAEIELIIPEDLRIQVQWRSEELAVPWEAVVLAAHARVLGALTGEDEVTTGWVIGPDSEAVPCPLRADATSWRGMVEDAARALAAVIVHQCGSLDGLRRELGWPPRTYEVEFSASGHDGGLADGIVLRVELILRGDHRGLRLIHRTEALDAGSADRIAGYHVAALRQIAADLAADPARQSLLSEREWRFQIQDLSGPRRTLPDARVHELFEREVRRHPHAVAATYRDQSWTYDELNRRANRLARALLRRGLTAEAVVGVVSERHLEWLAAVLAVFKAGGAYLPIEPHFPADRIATTLARADCRLVLSDPGSSTPLDEALSTLPDVTRLVIDPADDPADDTDLDVRVGPRHLAYLYFTSGSTGTPKGAMCEHAGFLNHVLAKIGDLGIDDRTVVAQTAPQCFDISLWQLVSALVSGGRTAIVEQDAILDVPRFVDRVVQARVNVLQLVPSYLEAVLTYLEAEPRALPDLRCVSVTGEAVKRELTQRWFAAFPDVALVNAYGLTETSDDTNHEVMRRVPDRDLVPLGPPIPNVAITIVDQHLMPVPLGAPGEIACSGVCVGRGYVNDPDRTRAVFRDDPHRPGQRMYLAGDFGRWLPEGKVEFWGRRDNQVKVSGFRIEIGEVENALLALPGVRDAAVVVASAQTATTQHLVGFYAADQQIPVEVLRDRLGATLAAYMVPTVFHWRTALPLTANGKVDRRSLTALAAEAEVRASAVQPPGSGTERWLAAAWSRVLSVPLDQIGRHDDFFERGGTSLSAVKLAIALAKAITPKDVLARPVLADLADLVDSRRADAAAATTVHSH